MRRVSLLFEGARGRRTAYDCGKESTKYEALIMVRTNEVERKRGLKRVAGTSWALEPEAVKGVCVPTNFFCHGTPLVFFFRAECMSIVLMEQNAHTEAYTHTK